MRYAWFFDGFKVYKVSPEQAIRFVKADLPKLTVNPLREREWYHGYVIMDYGNGRVKVGYLLGDLTQATKYDRVRPLKVKVGYLLGDLTQATKDDRVRPLKGKHPDKGRAYIPSREFYEVQTFAECSFEEQWEGDERHLFWAANLREKLINMQLDPDLFKVFTGIEADILDRYFGQDKWRRFFKKTHEDYYL